MIMPPVQIQQGPLFVHVKQASAEMVFIAKVGKHFNNSALLFSFV